MTEHSASGGRDLPTRIAGWRELERRWQRDKAYRRARMLDEDVRAIRLRLGIREGGFKKKRGDKEKRDEAAIKKWKRERVTGTCVSSRMA